MHILYIYVYMYIYYIAQRAPPDHPLHLPAVEVMLSAIYIYMYT